MKIFEFKQNDLKRGVPFAIIYCVAVFMGCYIYFGGMIGMANALENMGSAKAAGLLIGLAVLAPFIIILKVMMPKVRLELHSNHLIISNKKSQREIAYAEIYALQLNMSNLNRLDMIGQQNEVLAYIQPQNKPEILARIITEVAKHIPFTKRKGSKSYFGTSVDTAIYLRKNEGQIAE